MGNDLLLNVHSKEIRYALLRNGQLKELQIERKKTQQITGNIYRGKVTHILHNIQSAFIDMGEEENGFIHISDILENTKKFSQQFDMDFHLDYDIHQVELSGNKKKPIEELMKIDQSVLVQVVKEPIGNKGARLTSNISLGGRYLVLLPNSPHRGVSRKIEDPSAREELKKLISAFEMPHDIGLICRTASMYATKEALIDEARELLHKWEEIVKRFRDTDQPTILYEESGILKKALLTGIDKKFDRLLIDDYHTYQKCKKLYEQFKAAHPLKIELYRDTLPIFEKFNIEKDIDRATRKKVWLNSGGYLFFDNTEAMHTIDVNSGRSSASERNLEETIVKINLEATEEIARQLQVRNIGGLVIIDFIDMKLKRNQTRVLEKLKQCMKTDGAKCTILGMSEFGLVEMTRQRQRESLSQLLFTCCPYCQGSARIKTFETTLIEIERAMKKATAYLQEFGLKLIIHPMLSRYLHQEGEKQFLEELADRYKASLEIKASDELHLNDFQLYSMSTNKLLEL